MIANSGRFTVSLPVILANQPFLRFLALSDALYVASNSTWKINLQRLFDLIYVVSTDVLTLDKVQLEAALLEDYQRSGQKGEPAFIKQKTIATGKKMGKGTANKRQQLHNQ